MDDGIEKMTASPFYGKVQARKVTPLQHYVIKEAPRIDENALVERTYII